MELLESLWDKWPQEHRFGAKAFHCYLRLNRVQKARETLERIRNNKRTAAIEAQEELK